MATEVTEPLKITLDIAATVSAVVWPIVVVVVLYLLRERIPALLRELAGRVTKLDIAGVTLEFAKAKVFVPEFSSATAGIDLRQQASAMQGSHWGQTPISPKRTNDDKWGYVL